MRKKIKRNQKTPRLSAKALERAREIERAGSLRGAPVAVEESVAVTAEPAPAPTPGPAFMRGTARVTEIEAPAVFLDRGYMLLALNERAGKTHFLRCSTGEREILPTSEFLRLHGSTDIRPPWLAVSLLGRAVEGSFDTSAAILRQLLKISDDRDALLQMPPSSFGVVYERIVLRERGTYAPRVPTDHQVTEVLQRIHEERDLDLVAAGDHETEEENQSMHHLEGEAPSTSSNVPSTDASNEEKKEGTTPTTPPEEGAPAMQTAPASPGKSSAAKKGLGLSKKKPAANGAAKKALPKGLKEHQERKKKEGNKPITATNKKNPFRENSTKAKCFDLFAKGGERAKILEGMRKLGAKESTAASWYGAFLKVKGGG